MDLADKKCLPCEGFTEPLKDNKILLYFKNIHSDWSLNDSRHLFRCFQFNNFNKAMAFAKKVAKISDNEGHHPKLIVEWGKCSVEIWTHKSSGLSENDFYLAAKVDKIPYDKI